MYETIPELEQELKIFYRATIDKKKEEDSDIQRLLDAYRKHFDVDIVYVLENRNEENKFVYTNTSVSSPEYEIKDVNIEVSPEEYEELLQMYDEEGLSTEDKRYEEHDRIKSIIHFAAVFGEEICGCVGMIDCHNEHEWTLEDRRYMLKLGRVLSSHITKERLLRLNNAYREAAEAANTANMAKTRFLFSMSHDIRTPMNAVMGYTGMAKKYVDDSEKVSMYLDKISRAGHELLAIIDQVLEMSRIESGKRVLAEVPANVIVEMNAMMDVLAVSAATGNIEIESFVKHLEHENVLTDPESVTQVVLNVLSNAVKYTRPGGRIEYTIDEQPSDVPGMSNFHFITKDNGIGMSPEFLEHIFDEFARERSSTANRIQGTGLGMSIVKSLIDLLGGDIKITSELNVGTTVDVMIPMKTLDEPVFESETSVIADVAKLRGKRILLVEDNEMNMEIAADLLRSQGMIVETANDGDVAIKMVQEIVDREDYLYYDFVIMDVQMPRMNGFEATRYIRNIPAPPQYHLPIIAMTANAFEEDRQEALAAGMDEHIAKPIDISKLIQALLKYVK